MDRIKTGIKGFDEIVEGGIPAGFNVLLTGSPGTGKTIFGLQYLYDGALNGENGIYISLDSSEKRLKEQAKQFGWDFDNIKGDGHVFFIEVPVDRVKINLFEIIEDAVKQTNSKRLVFDNIASFVINCGQFVVPLNFFSESNDSKGKFSRYFGASESQENVLKGKTLYNTAPPEELSVKRTTYLIMRELETLNTTNLVIAFSDENNPQITFDGVSEFASDGIIALYNSLVGAQRLRTLSILKMRNTNHSPYIHNFEFVKDGISIKSMESVYK
ncbi:MAG: hypothetical protein M1122_03325 [Candidatus Marsarchaeota archaeon]|nr:hypothetical protein [Candidatus Marsarchaeota archaeon]